LAGFQKHPAEFDDRQMLSMGVSTDGLEDARRMVEEYGLAFPMAHALDAREFSVLTGALGCDRGYLFKAGA
jgi:peroxiredoxin